MRALLPARGRRLPRGLAALAPALALALALAGGEARADESFGASVERLWVRSDSLRVDYRVNGLLSDRVRDGLERGLSGRRS